MDDPSTQLLIESALAMGIGLFIGLEREHHFVAPEPSFPVTAEFISETPKPANTILGVRTFAILAILGWSCSYLAPSSAWFPAAAFLVVGALVGLQYMRAVNEGLGLTTEFAALVTFVLGMIVHLDRVLAVTLALGTTLLLLSKPWTRLLIPRLRRVELTATLQLLIVLAIVLPLLPAEPSDPWMVLSPRKIGLFIVLIAGISYVGYFLNRILGKRRGAGVTGIVGGLASSTALTGAMAEEARRDAAMILPAQFSVFLANFVMFARVLVVTAVLNRAVALALVLPLGAMGMVMLGGALWKWRVLRVGDGKSIKESGKEIKLTNPFALVPALKWGVILCVVLVISKVAQNVLGDRGLLMTAAASGLADVDPITLAVSREASAGTIRSSIATLAITIAVMANTAVKAGIAWFTGGREFGWHILFVFGTSMAIGVGIAAALG